MNVPSCSLKCGDFVFLWVGGWNWFNVFYLSTMYFYGKMLIVLHCGHLTLGCIMWFTNIQCLMILMCLVKLVLYHLIGKSLVLNLILLFLMMTETHVDWPGHATCPPVHLQAEQTVGTFTLDSTCFNDYHLTCLISGLSKPTCSVFPFLSLVISIAAFSLSHAAI